MLERTSQLRPSRIPARRALRATWLGLRLAVVVGVIALLVAWRGLGYIPLVVQTGSMEPRLPVGSMIFIKEQDPASVRVGDVITFDPPGAAMRTTHRVVDAIPRDGAVYFVTKGDANPSDDDWRPKTSDQTPSEDWQRGITYGDNDAYTVRGHVPWIGYVTILASHGWFRLALIVAAALWLAVISISWIWRSPASSEPAREADNVSMPEAGTSVTKEQGGEASVA